jgi:hypothetical protein
MQSVVVVPRAPKPLRPLIWRILDGHRGYASILIPRRAEGYFIVEGKIIPRLHDSVEEEVRRLEWLAILY